MKALLIVRSATGKRLTIPRPKLSHITPPPPWNGGIFRSRPDTRIYIRVDVSPSDSRFQFLGAQGGYFSDSSHEEIRYSSETILMVDVRFELTTSSSSPFDDDVMFRHLSVGLLAICLTNLVPDTTRMGKWRLRKIVSSGARHCHRKSVWLWNDPVVQDIFLFVFFGVMLSSRYFHIILREDDVVFEVFPHDG